MKILADVNVSRRVVERLRTEGIDIVRCTDLLDARTADTEILAEAARLGAIVLSHDQDFTALLATRGATGPSLINLRVSYVDVEQLTRRLLAVLQSTQAELSSGAIVTIDDARVRVHRLPVG